MKELIYTNLMESTLQWHNYNPVKYLRWWFCNDVTAYITIIYFRKKARETINERSLFFHSIISFFFIKTKF